MSLATTAKPVTLSIVTGASRGMGEAIALQLAARGDLVLGISRGHSEALASVTGTVQWAEDLSDAQGTVARLSQWLNGFDPLGVVRLNLINNAALLTSPGPARDLDAAESAKVLRVGLESVVLLCQATLACCSAWQCDKRILNVSSGNGRRALAGSAVYSAIKAGMDHYTRVLALDEAQTQETSRGGYTAAKVVSLAPGIIDTDMQVTLRTADPAKFAAQVQFAQYKAEGLLLSPHDAATRLLAYLDRPDFGSNPVADVRD